MKVVFSKHCTLRVRYIEWFIERCGRRLFLAKFYSRYTSVSGISFVYRGRWIDRYVYRPRSRDNKAKETLAVLNPAALKFFHPLITMYTNTRTISRVCVLQTSLHLKNSTFSAIHLIPKCAFKLVSLIFVNRIEYFFSQI